MKHSEKEKKKEQRRRRRFYLVVAPLEDAVFRKRLGYIHDDPLAAEPEGPVAVCFDHCCAYDPLFVGGAFRRRPLTFIASEHILRSRPWGRLLSIYISLIPHSKGARASRTALSAIKRIRRGESVFLAHEGEQTWDGVSMPVMPFTGKLIKSAGATLVTYRIEGAYLAKPRWAFSDRKGLVRGMVAGIYSPDDLRAMSEKEIEDAISRDTRFDVWEWQRSRPDGPVSYRALKGGNADGLERAVFTCPGCGRIGTLRSDGDYIGCKCGFRLRLTDTGFFESAEEQSTRFETIVDWEAFDRKALAARIEDAKRGASDQKYRGADAVEQPLFSDSDITLLKINSDHTDEQLASGSLSLVCGGSFSLRIADHVFRMDDIYDMKMVLASRILFSDSEGYYELRAAKKSRTNLRKYLIARELTAK